MTDVARYEPGSRVFAWALGHVHGGDDVVLAHGFGTYLGSFPRPGWQATLANPEERALYERAILRSDARADEQVEWLRREITASRRGRPDRAAELGRLEAALAAARAKPVGQRVDEILRFSALNPKILLDGDRGVVWGCECWWDTVPAELTEEQFLAAMLRGRELVLVPGPHPADTTDEGVPA